MSKPGPRDGGADQSGGGQPTPQDAASPTRTSGLNEALRLADLTSLEDDDERDGPVVRDQPTRVVSSISGSVPSVGFAVAARLSSLDSVASLEDGDEADGEHLDAPTRVISVRHASAVADRLRQGQPLGGGHEAATPAAPLVAAPAAASLAAALDALDSLDEGDGERLDAPTRVVMARELERKVPEVPSDAALLDSIFDTLEVEDDESHTGAASDASLESLLDDAEYDADEDGDGDAEASSPAASAPPAGVRGGEDGSGRWLGLGLLAVGVALGIVAVTMNGSGPLVAMCGAGAALLIAGAVVVLRGRSGAAQTREP